MAGKRRAGTPRRRCDDFPWFANRAATKFLGAPLTICTAHDVFSSVGIDLGTARLMRSLERAPAALGSPGAPRILDLGCGTGVLGIGLAKALEGAVVTLTDRDRLAVATARLNALDNRLDPDGGAARVLPAGLGYLPCREAGAGPFDLMVANVPAKAGGRGLRELLLGAGTLLASGAVLAFVHVEPIEATIDLLRAEFEAGGGRLETLYERAASGHRVLHWRFPDGLTPMDPALDPLDPWRRENGVPTMLLDGIGVVPHQAFQNLEEFAEEHHRNALLEGLARDGRPAGPPSDPARILVFNPGHGYLAARLARTLAPCRLEILDRDSLALAATLRNLDSARSAWLLQDDVTAGVAPADSDWSWLPLPAQENAGYDLIVGHPRWDEGPRAHTATLARLAAALRPDGAIILAVEKGRVQSLRHLARGVGLVHGRERSAHGFGGVVLKKS